MTVTEHTDDGVRVVGATSDDTATTPSDPPGSAAVVSAGGAPRRSAPRRSGGDHPVPRRAFRVMTLVAAVGLVGTLVFGVLFATRSGGGPTQDPAVISASRAFLTDFFNFNAKTVDSDFTAVTAMATGAFSTQAQQFFNTSIRTALEQALAESRGEIRALYVQSENQASGSASIYAVVDQTYVNNKITTPQADVVRLVATLQRVGGVWKIAGVTVLEGATPGSVGSPSGSAGSTVPGQ
jgi:hypothetical protein